MFPSCGAAIDHQGGTYHETRGALMLTRFVRLFCLGCGFVAYFAGAVEAAGPQVYRGQWRSQSTGHQGPMRVKVTPRADGNYDARFSGRFLVVIPFTYKVQLDNYGWSEAGQHLRANRQLGPLLGSYQMSAELTPGSLNGSFSAAGDTGSIHMRRVR